MGKYKVLDIFSFLPANVISLEQLEKMFLDSLSEISNNTKLGNEEIVVTCSSQSRFTENIKEYIIKLSTRKLYDESGQVHYCIDETLRRRLETKLITKILAFEVA